MFLAFARTGFPLAVVPVLKDGVTFEPGVGSRVGNSAATDQLLKRIMRTPPVASVPVAAASTERLSPGHAGGTDVARGYVAIDGVDRAATRGGRSAFAVSGRQPPCRDAPVVIHCHT